MTGALLGAAGAAAFLAASARWNWWRPRVRGLAVPMYHKIGDPPASSRVKKLWVRTRDFRRQLEFLLRDGWTPVLLSELSGALPPKPVLVTFDDGTADAYERAFPILKELGFKANVFLVCEAIGRHTAWEDPAVEPFQRVLDRDQILEMQASGLVEFGSHTLRHPDLARLSLEEARCEAAESRRRLEALLGRPVTAFAYPYGSGAYLPEVRATVRQAGYLHDFSIRQGITPWPWDPGSGPIRRLLVRRDDGLLDLRLNLSRGRARL